MLKGFYYLLFLPIDIALAEFATANKQTPISPKIANHIGILFSSKTSSTRIISFTIMEK